MRNDEGSKVIVCNVKKYHLHEMLKLSFRNTSINISISNHILSDEDDVWNS